MTLQPRDKRALVLFTVAAAGMLVYYLGGPTSGSVAKAVVPVDTVDRAQKSLVTLQQQAATLNAKETLLKQASLELAGREKGLIAGDTADQAQAQLLQILRRIGKDQTPALDIKTVEFGQPRPYGDAYGTVTVSVTFDCAIDLLVNYLAALTAQPELMASDEIRLNTSNPKQKTVTARLTISGMVPRRLIPEKKGSQF